VQRVEVEGDRRGVSLEVTALGSAALKQAERAMTRELEEVLRAAGGDRARARVVDGLDALGHAIKEHHLAQRL
jgi:DNA-binding MarR family transcriptional regulator